MTIKEEALKKWQNYRKLLFFVNIPLVFGLPVLLETGFADHKEQADRLYVFLQIADFFFAFNSIIIYQTLKRVVYAIHFLPEENKLQIEQFKSKTLGLVKFEIDPQDLIKCCLSNGLSYQIPMKVPCQISFIDFMRLRLTSCLPTASVLIELVSLSTWVGRTYLQNPHL